MIAVRDSPVHSEWSAQSGLAPERVDDDRVPLETEALACGKNLNQRENIPFEVESDGLELGDSVEKSLAVISFLRILNA